VDKDDIFRAALVTNVHFFSACIEIFQRFEKFPVYLIIFKGMLQKIHRLEQKVAVLP
jgi:hypothetical protein